MSGVDRAFVSLLERGLRQPTLTTVEKLAGALSMSPVQLVDAAFAERERGKHLRRGKDAKPLTNRISRRRPEDD